uniref:WD repeat domain 27 n=1 Tax=Astatotilapia calliptera TaxID=8154 RepID=A0A3P8NBC2_ASTCA
MAKMLTEKLSLTCDRLLSHRQLTCCYSYFSIPQHGKEVLVYSTRDGQQKPLILTGHHGDISALTFGKRSSPVILCSASADYVIVWDIELCKVAAGTVIGTLLGEVVHLSFCFSDARVAACTGATAFLRLFFPHQRPETIHTLTGHLGPVTSAEFCPWNNDILVTTSEDRTFRPISSLSWSLSRRWWLSASEDLSLQIWTHCNSEPAIIMGDKMFSKPIRGAQFYYLDKFVLLASGPSLYLYLYNLDITRDDIKRYHQRSVSKLAGCFATTSATDITALSAINDFFSHIVLVCGSDRSIQVFDMNKGTVASEVPDAHSRAIHCITQNKGSAFSSQAPDSYNLFLTSAVTDGMKIWDLRTLRCVRRYENHVNRCQPCSSAVSPCGRFIATGSEDNCAYVYDIRSSNYLHRLQNHSDTVLNVAFNPATPQVRL